MVDLAAGNPSGNKTFVAVVSELRGEVEIHPSGNIAVLGQRLELGNQIDTTKESAVVVRFTSGGAVILGGQQTLNITAGLLNKLKNEDGLIDLDSQSDSIVEALQRGESLDKLGTEAGGDSASAAAAGVRYEYTAQQIMPLAGEDTTHQAQEYETMPSKISADGDAGVTGVDDVNLDAVNAKVGAIDGVAATTVAEIQNLADTALAKISAYAEDRSLPKPSIQDYVDAGINGVDDNNIDAVNDLIDTGDKQAADELAEVQSIISNASAQLTAIQKIASYADDKTNPEPTLDDYTAAKVNGVTADNLTAVNALVDGLGKNDADTETEIEGLIGNASTQLTAIQKIANYADDKTNPEPTLDDYTAAKVDGVTADNLAAVNALVDAENKTDTDTQTEIEGLISNATAQLTAIQKIANYADDKTNSEPTLDDYTAAKVDGISAGNLAAVNELIDTVDKTDTDTQTEIEGLISNASTQLTAIQKIASYADDKTSPEPSLADYTAAKVDGVTADNLAAVNALVDGMDKTGSDTETEIEDLISNAVAQLTAFQKIANYVNDKTNPEPTLDDYIAAKVDGVTADNLAAVNALVDGTNKTDADTETEIETLINSATTQLTAIQKIANYADDKTNSEPTLDDYTAAKVDGISAGNLAAVNELIDTVDKTDTDTQTEIEGLISNASAQLTAIQKIAKYAGDKTNPEPNLVDYAAAKVDGVTADNLAAVNALVDGLGKNDADTETEIEGQIGNASTQLTAIQKIANYADDKTNLEPTLDDYIAAKVDGVTADNLAAVNALVDAENKTDTDTQTEIEGLISNASAQLTAIQKIASYADDKTNPEPTLDDYIAAKVDGVTADNLAAVNALVDGTNKTDADTETEIETLINNASAQLTAIQKIANYADDKTNSEPTLDDYTAAKVDGVTADNLAAVNALVDAENKTDADTETEIETLINNASAQLTAIQKIASYADDKTNPEPTLDDYIAAKVDGVTADNLAAVNALVDAENKTGSDTETEIEDLISNAVAQLTAFQKIANYANDKTNPEPTLDDYIAAKVDGVTADNLAAVNALVDGTNKTDADTETEIETLINNATTQLTAIQKIASYADDKTNPEPSLADYTAAKVDGVTADNLAAVNALVDAENKTGSDTGAEIENLISSASTQLTAIQKIANYADDKTNPEPNLVDYAAAKVDGVTADNLAAVNALVDGLGKNDADTETEIEGQIGNASTQLTAIQKIANYADDKTNPEPNLVDYAAAKVDGVTADNLAAVNALVDGLGKNDANTETEIEGQIGNASTQLTAIQKIANYADDKTNPEPTLDDYIAAKVDGVTADNLAAVNALVDAENKTDVDTEAEIEGLISNASAQLTAIQKIASYADDKTNPEPTLDDYIAAKVDGVTADNLAAVNALVDAENKTDVDTEAEIEGLISNASAQLTAIQKIANYADDKTNLEPTLDDYTAAKVDGVTADNVAAVNALVDGVNKTDSDTEAEIEGLISNAAAQLTAIQKIAIYAENKFNPEPTLDDYSDALVTGVTADNLAVVNGRVDIAVKQGADTTSEIQAIVNTTPPVVLGLSITGAEGAQNNFLNAGDKVTVTVNMSAVTYVTGSPSLNVNIGGTAVQAIYEGGDGSKSLSFSYTISAENDADGISVGIGNINLNGGSLVDSLGNAAEIGHSALADNAGYLVDTEVLASAALVITEAVDGYLNQSDMIDGTSIAVTLPTGTVEGDIILLTIAMQGGGSNFIEHTVLPAEVGGTANVAVRADQFSGDGKYNISATVTDLAGNVSPVTTTVITLDTIADGTPAGFTVVDSTGSTETITAGSTTNDNRPDFSGTGIAGSTITIFDKGVEIGSALVGGDSSWSFNHSNNFSDGDHNITITSTDVAGNESTPTAGFAFTVAPVNTNITIDEDQVRFLTVADFGHQDSVSNSAQINITSMSSDGVLQHKVGDNWQAVTLNSGVSIQDIKDGKLRFIPDENESGSDANNVDGIGATKNDYAQINFRLVEDGIEGGEAKLIIDVAPVADGVNIIGNSDGTPHNHTTVSEDSDWTELTLPDVTLKSSGEIALITLNLTDLPAGFGVRMDGVEVAAGATEINLTQAQLSQVQIKPASNYNGNFSLNLTAASLDGSNASDVTTFEVDVKVSAIQDGVISAVSDVNTGADILLLEASTGDVINITAAATDLDIEDSISYSLVDDFSGLLSIDPVSGVVTIADASKLSSYNAGDNIDLVVKADSSDGSSSQKTFSLLAGVDTDGDGIINKYDIDDDNDGIIDINEVSAGEAEAVQIDISAKQWSGNKSDGVVSISGTDVQASSFWGGILFNRSNSGSKDSTVVKINISDPGVNQEVNVEFVVRQDFKGHGFGYSSGKFELVDENGTVIDSLKWSDSYSINGNVISGDQNNETISLSGTGKGLYVRVHDDGSHHNGGNTHSDKWSIQSMQVTGQKLADNDVDGDGIDNSLDVDSDNDGESDNREAQTTSGFIAASGIDIDKDGLDDAYDADTSSKDAGLSQGLTAIDSNADGNADYLDGTVTPLAWQLDLGLQINPIILYSNSMVTPLVLDLDGDGVETLSKANGVIFDIDADGDLDRTGWAGADDGLLVRDINDDGKINDASELFGESTAKRDGDIAKDGFAALSDLDSNNDGIINKDDAAFGELNVWRDSNSDGITQEGELLSMRDIGLSSIDLEAETIAEVDQGNVHGLRSEWTDTDGEQHAIDDVWFATEKNTGTCHEFSETDHILDFSKPNDAVMFPSGAVVDSSSVAGAESTDSPFSSYAPVAVEHVPHMDLQTDHLDVSSLLDFTDPDEADLTQYLQLGEDEEGHAVLTIAANQEHCEQQIILDDVELDDIRTGLEVGPMDNSDLLNQMIQAEIILVD